MTQVMLQIAEDFFLANDPKRAYRMAKTALQLDPFYGDPETIDRYVAAYSVHAAALKKLSDGEPDWYNILGVDDYSVPGEEIAHLFCKMYKLINHEDLYSAAAKGAHKLLGKAFEIVGDMDTRIAFHKRCNLPLVFREKLAETSEHHLNSTFNEPAARKLQQERSVKKTESSDHHLKSMFSEPAARKLQQERSVKKIEFSGHHLKSKFSEPASRKQQQPQERWDTKKMEISVRHMNTARRSTTGIRSLRKSSSLKPCSVGIFKKQGSCSSSFVPRRMFK